MFTDTHCHLYKEYYENLEEILNHAYETKVNRFIVAGCDSSSNKEVFNLVQEYKNIYGCVGIHPEETLTYKINDLEELEQELKSDKIVAIGEIGLDYHYDKENKELQKKLFIKQLEIAKKYMKPVVIHSRDATQDTINILKEFPNVIGDIHCFSGSPETAKVYISMGYKIGIGGVVTFKNSNLYKVVDAIGIKNILLETDSPYLTPVPYRGQKNSSKYIPLIAEKVAEILNLSIENVSENTLSSTYNLFDLK